MSKKKRTLSLYSLHSLHGLHSAVCSLHGLRFHMTVSKGGPFNSFEGGDALHCYWNIWTLGYTRSCLAASLLSYTKRRTRYNVVHIIASPLVLCYVEVPLYPINKLQAKSVCVCLVI